MTQLTPCLPVCVRMTYQGTPAGAEAQVGAACHRVCAGAVQRVHLQDTGRALQAARAPSSAGLVPAATAFCEASGAAACCCGVRAVGCGLWAVATQRVFCAGDCS